MSPLHEIGCGEGRFSRLLSANRSVQLTAIDYSRELLRAAARQNDGFPVRLCRADAHSMPFPAHRFRSVVAMMCFHDLDDPLAALADTHRVLEPGGELVAAIIHPAYSSTLVGPDGEGEVYSETVVEQDTKTRLMSMHHSRHWWFQARSDVGFEVVAEHTPVPSEPAVHRYPALARLREHPMYWYFRARPR